MPPGSRTPVLAGKAGVDAPTRHAQLSRKDQQHEAIVVKLSGMPFDPIYEIDDDTIAIGDLVRVPGSDSAFIEEGETGIVDIQVHQDSSSTQERYPKLPFLKPLTCNDACEILGFG
jgi:hypothetical protein